MNVLITLNDDNLITGVHYMPEMVPVDQRGEWIEIDNYVQPEYQEGKETKQYYRDGKVVNVYVDITPEKTPLEKEVEKLQKAVAEQAETILFLSDTVFGGAE